MKWTISTYVDGAFTGSSTGSGCCPSTAQCCSYSITATLDWSQGLQADLDIYAENVTDGGVCYYAVPAAGGFFLDHDAFPDCQATPLPPEVITGSFTASKTFMFWYNQNSNCASEVTPTTKQITVTNNGTCSISVNGNIIAPNASYTVNTIAYAGYNTGVQDTYLFGTIVSVSCLSPGSSSSSSSSSSRSSSSSSRSSSSSSSSAGGITTVCCANAIPTTLYATLSNNANFACVSGTITLTYDAMTTQWSGSGPLGTCGRTVTLGVQCQAGTWYLYVSHSDFCYTGNSAAVSATCSPLNLQFLVGTAGACGATGFPSTYRVTVTT